MNIVWLRETHSRKSKQKHKNTREETFRTFSSPMLNLPWVSLCFSTNACSFLIGSDWDISRQNSTFCFVYSWPGCKSVGKSLLCFFIAYFDLKIMGWTYIDLGIVWKPSKNMIQGIIHLFSSSLKESAASCQDIVLLVLEYIHSISVGPLSRCIWSALYSKQQILG